MSNFILLEGALMNIRSDLKSGNQMDSSCIMGVLLLKE